MWLRPWAKKLDTEPDVPGRPEVMTVSFEPSFATTCDTVRVLAQSNAWPPDATLEIVIAWPVQLVATSLVEAV